ncbi:MAG: hypothetical protein P1Q69_16815 [Candidatus Thorarchaeota archaeon]|nr:hypothetical protein [Candidatus Thorarchaeota archaeon]
MLLTPIVLSTTFLFVDSYSLSVWQRETAVGPASIVITGSDAHIFSSSIEQIPGINNTAYLVNSWASVLSLANNTIPDLPFLTSEMIPAPDQVPNIKSSGNGNEQLSCVILPQTHKWI